MDVAHDIDTGGIRLHHIKEPTRISWAALKPQFGADIKGHRHSKNLFKADLALALAVYPEAKVDVILDEGIVLHNSPPPVNNRKPRMSIV